MLRLFFIFIFCLLVQRLVEIVVARKNEKWMKAQGAVEYDSPFYKYIVMLHTLFFVSLIAEVVLLQKGMSAIAIPLFTIFFLTQLLRIWAIYSLGRFWNTKVIVLKDVYVKAKGPYRWIRHPNYLVVGIEMLVVPLLFQAYGTAFLFSVLNMYLLSIRISREEKALRNDTAYDDYYKTISRFFPTRPVK